LACILTLPPYQQKGYGKFLIALSYELSKREKKIGTPERPLSDMGRISYKSYWTDTILQLIREKGNLSLKEITDETGIAPNDVMETLSSLNMVKYWKGQYIISIANNKAIEEHFKKKELKKQSITGYQVKFNPTRLIHKSK
jgi:histone acetyltransferase MYST1